MKIDWKLGRSHYSNIKITIDTEPDSRKMWEITVSVNAQLDKFNEICLYFSYGWLRRRIIFPLQAHGLCVWKYEHVHPKMPYYKVINDGINISITVLKSMKNFTIKEKFIAYTINGASTVNTCQDALEGKVTNTAIYRTLQTNFWQDLFAHALQGECKSAVLGFKSEDYKGAIIVCITVVQKVSRLVVCGQRRFYLVQYQ